MTPKISAIVFAFWPEEENYIETCFKTISWADEVIVIDNGASEKTITIAKKYASRIIKTTSRDFSKRHNLATSHATGEWLFYIDADERISTPLAVEMRHAVENNDFDAFELNRVNFFLGKKVRFGDRFPDHVARLFRKDKLEGWTGSIHESTKVNGSVGRLKNPLYHITHRDIFSMLEKTINYSENEADLRFRANHPLVVWWRFPRVVLTELYVRLIKYQGIRAGTEGWIDGFFQALSVFVIYARLWEKQRRPSLERTYKDLDRDIESGNLP